MQNIAEEAPSQENDDQNEIICVLLKRARNAKILAVFGVILIVVIAFLMVVFFFISSINTSGGQFVNSIKLEFLGITYETQSEVKHLGDIGKAFESPDTAKGLLEYYREESERNFAANIFTNSVVRIGSLVIAVYLIQIMVSLTRYYFRLSDHIASVAQAIRLSKNDLNKLAELVTILSPIHIDILKQGSTPQEKVVEMMSKAIEKIPTSKNT